MALLEVENLTVAFGGLVAVHGLSFHVDEGEILGIIGPNGAGKTTVFNAVTGFVHIRSGRIRFAGRDITRHPVHPRCWLGIARTFQLMQPVQEMTVAENILTGILYGRGHPPPRVEAHRQARSLAEMLGLGDRYLSLACGLTTADQKRLEVARALATQPRLLLLDEVMAGLTPAETEQTADLIRALPRRGVTVVLIEHVMWAVRNLCSRVLVMHFGEKLAEGSYDEVASDPRVLEAYLGEEVP